MRADNESAQSASGQRCSPANGAEFQQILSARLSRRGLLAAGLGAAAGTVLASCSGETDGEAGPGPYGFVETPWNVDAHLHVPPGYRADVLLRWGDPLGEQAPAFEPHRMTGEAQQRQFGYNCDYTAFVPLGPDGNSSGHGLLAVNHEYSWSPLMYPGSPLPTDLSAGQLLADMAAHGMSIVEVVRNREGWRYLPRSAYNRRITPHTAMRMDGPAAGHHRLRLNHRDGFSAKGTWNNCAGGMTPWGTVLTAEENTHVYFQGNPAAGSEAENHRRYGVTGKGLFAWHLAEQRWQLDRDPGYPLYGGWIVEVDPRDPDNVPIKHTALGRMRHEGCTVTVNGDGRVVCYLGDDQAFEYLYRYVSRGRLTASPQQARQQNQQLLQDGELSVATFHEDGSLQWLPLVYGRGPLTPDNDFHDQGDVLLDTRRAADLLGATPMDRPEGIAISPDGGRVYCSMTNNPAREEANAANPRSGNLFGHILECSPPGGDHTAEYFRWEVFLLAGRNDRESLLRHQKSGTASTFVCPDNLAFDPGGALWIATDGATGFGLADALLVCDVSGGRRRLASRFLTAPLGAEVTGPSFTPDGGTLFCSIQHPGAVPDSNFERPATRWPDFHADTPPRPSVIAVTRLSGGRLTD